MTGPRTILVSMLVLAGATCIACGVLEDFMASDIMKNAKGANPFANGFKLPSPFNGGAPGSETKITLGGFLNQGLTGGAGGAGGEKAKIEGEYGDKKGPLASKVNDFKIVEAKGTESGKQEGFLGCKTPAELVQLSMNPPELTKRVKEHYNQNKGRYSETMSRAVSRGVDVSLQPALACLKFIERVFVPDVCRLKLVCQLGKPFAFSRGYMPKISSRSLESSAMMKAFHDGLQALDCEAVYSGCKNGGPKLKKMFQGSQGAADTSGAFASFIDAGKASGGQMLNMLKVSGQQ